ncbi:transcriptional regulator [Brevibacillus agri]|uniref:transcriptional regulator n=1 Tax=Brevibacillus agri TaxID=51101 RepID=UPI0021ADE703|nr:transcriptional regulator [Brevibacillus agri]
MSIIPQLLRILGLIFRRFVQTTIEVKEMFGLGKPRSRLGKWLDSSGKTQRWLVAEAKISEDTATRVCSDGTYIPGNATKKKILDVVRRIDPNLKHDDFWPM